MSVSKVCVRASSAPDSTLETRSKYKVIPISGGMTRGNQREIDRQRAANRHAGKGTAKEGDFLLRKVIENCLSSWFLVNNLTSPLYFKQEADAKALADKVAAKKAREEAIARGEILPEAQKGGGGGAKKKDGTKK